MQAALSEDTTTASPQQHRRVLLLSLFATYTVLFASYGALVAVFLPQQVAAVDPVNKVANLAFVTSASAFVAMFIQPVIGSVSDRTRTRFGRRTPWMICGSVLAAVFMLNMAGASTIAAIAALWILIQASLNMLQGPASAISIDRFPVTRRGSVSGFIGAGVTLGMAVGVVAAGSFEAIGTGYAFFAVAVVVVTVGFSLLNREPSSLGRPRTVFSWKSFLGSFWISPRRHPDYFWAFTGRFLIGLAHHGIIGYLLYILQDHIGMTVTEAVKMVGVLVAVQLVGSLLTVLAGGILSDRLQRRKIFVIGASLLMAVAFMIPLLLPTRNGMFVFALLFGLAYGCYTSVDKALMTLVLPDAVGSAGKDLGILNIATNLPQAIAPPLAWLVISLLHGYQGLFLVAAGFTVLATIAVSQVRSVR